MGRLVALCLILIVLLGASTGALAQSEDDAWGDPVNVSRSGAAEQPQIVAAPDGRLQVFWQDRFDGLTSARCDGTAWSAPFATPILELVEVRAGEFESSPVEVVPTIVADGRGWVHAFWIGEEDEYTGGTPLMHAQMLLGGTAWSSPEVLAESAVAFETATAPTGGLTLAYARVLHSDVFPAGVYVKRTAGGGAAWGPPAAVYGSIYFRLMTAEEAHLYVADGGDGTVYLAWEDPYQELALYAGSSDGGFTWSAPEPLGDVADRPARSRVFALPGGDALRMWEASALGGCALTQQRFNVGVWGEPERVWGDLTRCPQGERAWTRDDGLFWLWGEGTDALALAVWDAKAASWSEPRSFTFRSQDPETGRWIGLGDLHAALIDGALAVAGSDGAGGEVWAVVGQSDALDLAFAPPSPWSEPVCLSPGGAEAEMPVVALDADGRAHVVWSQPSESGRPGTALFHAGPGMPAVRIVNAADGEMARQPALVADGRGLLHLVWSGGEQGQVFYSRAQAGGTGSADGWLTPRELPAPSLAGAWPQIGVDAAGRLYVAYAVPLNEGRGIYLVRSEDGGETWSGPELVFDAAVEEQAVVDRLALAVSPEGALHVAWVAGALPGTWPSQGVYYTRSQGDNTWSEPMEIAGAGSDWPALALTGGQVHVLYAEVWSGGVYHRRSDARDEGGWSTAARVSGWDDVAAPFGLAADGGGTLHLVGVGAGGAALLYSAWEGARWSAPETPWLKPKIAQGLGAAAATAPTGGQLAVALRALPPDFGAGEAGAPAVFYASRAIPGVDVVDVPPPATPPPDATVVPSPTPMPTLAPSPTPDLSGGAEPAGSTQLPLILGGGLAVAVVVGVLVVWGVRRVRGNGR